MRPSRQLPTVGRINSFKRRSNQRISSISAPNRDPCLLSNISRTSAFPFLLLTPGLLNITIVLKPCYKNSARPVSSSTRCSDQAKAPEPHPYLSARLQAKLTLINTGEI